MGIKIRPKVAQLKTIDDCNKARKDTQSKILSFGRMLDEIDLREEQIKYSNRHQIKFGFMK